MQVREKTRLRWPEGTVHGASAHQPREFPKAMHAALGNSSRHGLPRLPVDGGGREVLAFCHFKTKFRLNVSAPLRY